MKTVNNQFNLVFANTYALYLKTQNYHWHVKGAEFKGLHELFETQYMELAEAVDSLAERILMMGHKAPATFTQLNQLKTIKDGDSSIDAHHMLNDLAGDQTVLIKDLSCSGVPNLEEAAK